MQGLTKHETLKFIASMQESDPEEQRRLIMRELARGNITEEDVATIVAEDVRRNLGKYEHLFRTDDELRHWWNRFAKYPKALARALVRIRPDLFYTKGFAKRIILKLRANLGPVIIYPGHPGDEPEASVFNARLPEAVCAEIVEIDRECRFRDVLYLMSRDPQIGFDYLRKEIEKATDAYTREILTDVRDHCARLLAMRFPGFVTTINGNPFPAFHVRWWIDRAKDALRILNIGDTGMYKTSAGVLTMHTYGCRKVLVLCAPNARLQWKQEIESYFTKSAGRAYCIESAGDVAAAVGSNAEFTIIGYSTLIRDGVVSSLERIPFDGVIWDECQYGKNITRSGEVAEDKKSDGTNPKGSQRAIACMMLIRKLAPKRVVALSATPWENHPLELAALAAVLRPDLFPSVESFREAHPEDPRFLRELFDDHILEGELRDVRDLPTITPEPWVDLFGAELIPCAKRHEEIYDHVREDDTKDLRPSEKVTRLLSTATHPHIVQSLYDWPEKLDQSFHDTELSTKLKWIRQQVTTKLNEGAKIVIASGIFATGVTARRDDDKHMAWVGGLLQEWFGKSRVLILDGSVALTHKGNGDSPRSLLIRKWRTDPEARILLVSMRTCPDSINLTIPKFGGITKLFITALSFGWVPWKQFLGRFWREGQGVPVEYRVPVLSGTIDECLLRLIRRKWELQQMFRMATPLSHEEYAELLLKKEKGPLAEISRSDIANVYSICSKMLKRGENGARQVLATPCGLSTNGAVFAESFVRTQPFSTSGHIARFMKGKILPRLASRELKAETIADMGCGPLTVAWILGAPVISVDMNEHMIAAGRERSPHLAKNAMVGHLSQLPKEWTSKFKLTVTSLVLDWTSLTERVNGIPERLFILRELVRTTHPQGHIWMTATKGSMDEDCITDWTTALERQGFVIDKSLTGLVRSRTKKKSGKYFEFWSLCFSPNGKQFVPPRDTSAFRYLFEKPQRKYIRGSDGSKQKHSCVEVEHDRTVHDNFEVIPVSDLVARSRE